MMQIQTIGAVRTMTSREIAAIAEKRHDNVMRVCRDLRDTGVCPQIEETPYTEPTNGHAFSSARFTPKGVAWVSALWGESAGPTR